MNFNILDTNCKFLWSYQLYRWKCCMQLIHSMWTHYLSLDLTSIWGMRFLHLYRPQNRLCHRKYAFKAYQWVFRAYRVYLRVQTWSTHPAWALHRHIIRIIRSKFQNQPFGCDIILFNPFCTKIALRPDVLRKELNMGFYGSYRFLSTRWVCHESRRVIS